MNDRNITNARFIQVNQLPQIGSHLAAKLYVDNAIDEISLVRNNKKIDFGNNNLTNINSITLNNQALNDNEVNTKAYLDQFHQENERSRRDLGIDFYSKSSDIVKNNQDNNPIDNKLTNINSITVNRKPSSDNELANKKYIADELDKNTIVRFNQTPQNYLKVSVGNITYNLTKYDKTQITDTTVIKYPNTGRYLIQQWIKKCNDKNNGGKIQNFIRSSKKTTPGPDTGAKILPPIDDSFMFIETRSNNHEAMVFCSFERTDIIQMTHISFYCNRYSAENDNRTMERFRIQLLLTDNTLSTKYIFPKNDQYTKQSEWILVNLNFIEENYVLN